MIPTIELTLESDYMFVLSEKHRLKDEISDLKDENDKLRQELAHLTNLVNERGHEINRLSFLLSAKNDLMSKRTKQLFNLKGSLEQKQAILDQMAESYRKSLTFFKEELDKTKDKLLLEKKHSSELKQRVAKLESFIQEHKNQIQAFEKFTEVLDLMKHGDHYQIYKDKHFVMIHPERYAELIATEMDHHQEEKAVSFAQEVWTR